MLVLVKGRKLRVLAKKILKTVKEVFIPESRLVKNTLKYFLIAHFTLLELTIYRVKYK